MGIEMGMWRIDGGIQKISLGDMPSEEQLESLLERDPSILGEPLLVVGRQVVTDRGKRIDLLAIDGDGSLRILELKKGRAPRDAVTQVLEYGAWVQKLSHGEVVEMFEASGTSQSFESAFETVFGYSPPEEINTGHKLTLVSTEIDEDSQAIIEYLDSNYGVPINVAFFRYFKDGDHEYMARSYLIEEEQEISTARKRGAQTREPWNGTDWYVAFDKPWWDEAMELGFVSAGGGDWYTRTLRNLPVGGRVWVCIPKTGYVGVGTVTGEAKAFRDSHVSKNEKLLEMGADDKEYGEWIVPITWLKTLPKDKAVWEKGMFANQNSACKLRNSFTLETLHKAFKIGSEG